MNTICKGVKKASTVGATAALLVAMAPSVALAEEGASGADILQVFVLEEMADRVANMAKVKLVSPEVLKELCETQTPQGIVAEVAKQSQALPESLSGKYLLLEDVQDPGNVGTMIRTADAAGYDGVFLSDKSADIYNQKTLRSMQGSHFHLPIYRGPILDMVEACKKQGVPVLATTLSDISVDYKAVKTDGNFALVMGNEVRELVRIWLSLLINSYILACQVRRRV